MLDRFLSSLLVRRLPETRLSIKEALALALTEHAEGLPARESTAALAEVGINLVNARMDDGMRCGVLQIEVDPRRLRSAYPKSPRLEPHTFVFRFALGAGVPAQAGNGVAAQVCLPAASSQPATRYIGGICDRDELRMQVEVLRQPLGDLGITIDTALDELCAGLQSPCAEARACCNSIVRALECCGLRFYAARRSWRLPRAGVLVIEQPDALVRSHPSLAFFEPGRFLGLAIVDRPGRAGNEVRQGLLF